MVRAHQPVQVTARLCANHRTSVPADIVECTDGAVVASNDDDGVGIDLEREVIPRLRYLASVPGKEPTGSPDTFDVQAVQLSLAIKLTRQRPALAAGGEQPSAKNAVGVHVPDRIESVRLLR